MSDRFGLYAPAARTLVSQGGRVIVHDSKAELEFLFPGVRVVPVSPLESPVLPLAMVRGMEPVRFPLDRKDFR